MTLRGKKVGGGNQNSRQSASVCPPLVEKGGAKASLAPTQGPRTFKQNKQAVEPVFKKPSDPPKPPPSFKVRVSFPPGAGASVE